MWGRRLGWWFGGLLIGRGFVGEESLEGGREWRVGSRGLGGGGL